MHVTHVSRVHVIRIQFPENEHFGLVIEFAENGMDEYMRVNYNILSVVYRLRKRLYGPILRPRGHLIKMLSICYNKNSNILYVFYVFLIGSHTYTLTV